MTQGAPRLRWAVQTAAWGARVAPEEWAFLLSLLPNDEQQQCLRHRQPEDQRRALVARLLARRAAAASLGLTQSAVDCRRTKGGKPYVANDVPGKANGPAPNWNFSVSHEVRVGRGAIQCPACPGPHMLPPAPSMRLTRRCPGNHCGLCFPLLPAGGLCHPGSRARLHLRLRRGGTAAVAAPRRRAARRLPGPL